MRKVEITLDASSSQSREIIFGDDEDRILLNVSDHPGIQTINYILGSPSGNSRLAGNLQDNYIRINREMYNSISFSGDFGHETSARIEMYLGFWSEILIRDLTLNLNSMYQSAEAARVAFVIGIPSRSNLTVEPLYNGDYRIKRTIALSKTRTFESTDVIFAGSETINEIRHIYEAIRENVLTDGFILHQNQFQEQLQENTFNFLTQY